MAFGSASGVCQKCGYREQQGTRSPLHRAPRSELAGGQYLLGRVLGHGGFGITYLGWDCRLERRVAVKEYFPAGVAMRAGDGAAVAPYSSYEADYRYGLERFLEEARLLARFNAHPHILSVLNFFSEGGTAYIVTEYLEGRTLEKYLEQNGGRVNADEAIALLKPVMRALEEVHAAGIVHRDVTPDNIHIGPGRHVKLLDFGAARMEFGERSRNLSVILKEGYAPAEQYRSKGHQGPWTDVYAVAATFYRALTGSPPPPALDRMSEDGLRLPSVFGVALAEYQESALCRALAFDPKLRQQTMAEFRRALTRPPGDTDPTTLIPSATPAEWKQALEQARAAQPPPSPPATGWPSWVWMAVGAGCIGVLLVGFLVLR